MLAETDRVAIVHFALRNKTRLAALRVKDFSKRDVMVIHTLLWPDEIRDPDFPVLDKEVEIKAAELKMAGQVVESMTDDFHPERFEDTYQEQLKELVEATQGGEAFTTEEAEPKELDETEDVSDLLAKLEASVKARRGGSTSGDGQAEKGAREEGRSREVGDNQLGQEGDGQKGRSREVGDIELSQESARQEDGQESCGREVTVSRVSRIGWDNENVFQKCGMSSMHPCYGVARRGLPAVAGCVVVGCRWCAVGTEI